MAGNKSKYLSDELLNWLKGTSVASAPANTYVALFTTLPAYDGTGGTEVSGGAYARVAVASSGWAAISNGANGDQTSNSAAVDFTTPSASWGTVLGFGLYDASTAGNLLWFADLTTSKTINSGDTVSFAIGALVVAED